MCSTCLLPLNSTSIQCGFSTSTTFTPTFHIHFTAPGLQVFYQSFPTFTPNFHIYSMWITHVLRVFPTCRLPLLLHLISTCSPRGLRIFSTCPNLLCLISASSPRGLRVFYASFPRVHFHYFYAKCPHVVHVDYAYFPRVQFFYA